MSQEDQFLQSSDDVNGHVDIFWAMLLMFFVSGVAALTYQIVWVRQLELVFGVSLYATSAVVATFMGGLAIGSLYFGRLVDRWDRPLVLFALLEAGIAAFGLVFPVIVVWLRHSYVVLYGPFGGNQYVLSLVRFLLAFLVLIVPTSLMGGTLPVIVRAYVVGTGRLGRNVATLYSANNMGAFVGCVAAGYVLLKLLGTTGTLRLAALLNLAAAATSLYIDSRRRPASRAVERRPEQQTTAPIERGRLGYPVRVALWVLGLQGAASLVYQMAWIRTLIFIVHTDIFGVTAIVGTFLAGLSLGAFLCRRWIDRLRNPYLALGVIELGIGVAALATIPALPFLLGIHNVLLGWGTAILPAKVAFVAADFAVTFVVILVPTAFMGAMLPVASRIYVKELQVLGRGMGVLGCLDTIGSVLGAFAGAFIMIPLLGIQRTIIVTVLLNIALAGWVFLADPISERGVGRRPGFIASVLCLLSATLLLFARPMPLINYSRAELIENNLDLVEYREDQVSCVSVLEDEYHSRILYVNDQVCAVSNREDRPSHEMELHVPLLLHPSPKRALIIGLGSGQSVGACLAHNVQVDVVELSPSVVRVNHCFDGCFEEYRREHHGLSILDDPRVRVRIEDGRNFVLVTRSRYDVIHVGGFHPLSGSGAASFFTVEFYKDCQRLLTPDGIFTGWLPLHMPMEDLKIILRSFHEAFPDSSVWFKHSGEFCMLLGTLKPLRIDFQRLEQRMNQPSVRAHLARCDIYKAWDLLDSLCLSAEGIGKAIGDGPLQTDEHPYIEYDPLLLAGPTVQQLLSNQLLLEERRERVWPYLVDVPEDRREEVKAQLEKCFEGTTELSKGSTWQRDSRWKPNASSHVSTKTWPFTTSRP